AEIGGGAAVAHLLRRLEALAARFADGERPEPARSSPAEWLAWCLATGGIAADAAPPGRADGVPRRPLGAITQVRGRRKHGARHDK
ncbi:MAG: hypothetical protein ACREET_02650, partial [Stellaceae bacterium]